ncbi:MAG TPA: hypothetical protein VEQ38_15510 [Verrucomicrobiae bacterium]|nr:hypothetical protein [Verrucomicrobiae bacterium]
MLMQDSLTGYLHEVPDLAEAEPYGEVAYDGFGNPVGFFGRRRRRRRAPEPAPQAAPPAPMPPEGALGPEMGPEGGEEMPGGEEMGEVAYDGFGNPIGFSLLSPFKAIGKAVGGALTTPFRLLQSAGRALPGLPFPGRGIALPGLVLPALMSRLAAQRRLIQQHRMSGRPVPPALLQNYQRLLGQYRSARTRRQRWPLGWRRPPLPYTGLGPRRVYMRCAMWPGPKGLVPAYAAQMSAAAIQQMAAQRAAAMGRRRRRRRRRR